MKKFFTLVCMAFVAMSVNAQEPGIYPVKSITWGDIIWKNGNNKKDKDNKDMLFLMGTSIVRVRVHILLVRLTPILIMRMVRLVFPVMACITSLLRKWQVS